MADDTATAPAAQTTTVVATGKSPVKPGWQTTEFWLHTVVQVCGIVMAALPSNSQAVRIAGMVMSVLSALGYGATRASIKNAAAILLPIFLVFSLSGCKVINKDALAAWTAGDVAIMQDLEDYRSVQGKPIDDVKAHLAKAFGDITADEENSLVAETLADVQADPKRDPKRKATYATKVSAHLNLFNSLKN